MFWVYNDVQTSTNKGKGVKKKDLAQWISVIFKKKNSCPTIFEKGLNQLACTSQISNIMKFQ